MKTRNKHVSCPKVSDVRNLVFSKDRSDEEQTLYLKKKKKNLYRKWTKMTKTKTNYRERFCMETSKKHKTKTKKTNATKRKRPEMFWVQPNPKPKPHPVTQNTFLSLPACAPFHLFVFLQPIPLLHPIPLPSHSLFFGLSPLCLLCQRGKPTLAIVFCCATRTTFVLSEKYLGTEIW